MTNPAALEIASYVARDIGLPYASTVTVLAQSIQKMIDQGRIVGRVMTGDHLEGDNTVPDWTEMP